ncbi:MAG: MATE family efflux transporter, partial [Tissierellia bacterium]|nr:MATE family efflux transporter [Tissierellia bacterium]
EDFGTAVMAAYALVNRVTGLVMQPAMGIGGGLTSIVGQNLGARKPERVTEAFHKANLINLVVSGLGAIAIFIWAEQLILFFLQSGAQDVLHHSMIYIYYILPTIPLMGMFSIFQGLFQGSGFTKYAMYMEIGRLWVIRLPMIVILSRFSNMGSTAIWLAMSMSNLLTIAYGFYLYRRKHWLGEFRPA